MNKLEDFFIILIFIAVSVAISFMAFEHGYLRGYEERGAWEVRSDCLVEFKYTAQSEIEGRCLKYFLEETE